MGIEPTRLAWKARTLPLSYTRPIFNMKFNQTTTLIIQKKVPGVKKQFQFLQVFYTAVSLITVIYLEATLIYQLITKKVVFP